MALTCPYCRTPLEAEEGTKTCEGCGTPHHSECYEENGGCTLFGCKFAPPDDPKVQVSTGDVSQAVLAPMPGMAYMPRPTGFGDVNAPLAAAVAISDVPPPPPPPAAPAPEPPFPLDGVGLLPPQPSLVPAASTLLSATAQPPKSRLAFILLGIFLGSLGVHNFYAGYIKRGVAQLVVTIGTVFYGSVVTWIWALIEVCTVDRDNSGVSFV